jgi:mannose-6-phosphate isomerase
VAERRGKGLQIPLHGFKSRPDLHFLQRNDRKILRIRTEVNTLSDESKRPWGRYEILQESSVHKVKCIYVNPGARLSYQRHQKRAEHWFIVSGTATVVLDGQTFTKQPGETVDVAIGQLHRIGNTGEKELIFIEIQTGTYFGEDDIERIEDDFSR